MKRYRKPLALALSVLALALPAYFIFYAPMYVAREPIENFDWEMLKGKNVLGGRAGERQRTI